MKNYKLIKILLFTILLFTFEINAQVSNIIFEDDFDESYLTEWEVRNETAGDDNWYLEGGYLIQDSNIGSGYQRGTNLIKKNLLLDDFTIRSQFYATDDDYTGVVFRYTDSDNYYKFVLSGQRTFMQLQKRVNGSLTTLDSYPIEWPFVGYTVTVAAYGNNLKVYLNDKLYLEANDNSFASGSFGLMTCYNNGNFFDWVKVYDVFQVPEVDDTIAIIRHPYVQSLTDSSVAILWGSSKSSLGLLEVGIDTTSYTFIDENISTSNHQVNVSDLLEGTKYFYRVKSGNVYSEWESFTTFEKNPSSFSFIVYGDTRTNFLRHNEVTENFADHKFDFIVHTGDPVQRGPRNDWNVEFFNPIQKYIKNKPLYMAIGNHELNAQNFYDYFDFPNKDHENYYSFTLGNSFFLFIDNNRARYTDDTRFPSIKPGSPQYIWIDEQLSSEEAQTADWIFVFSHVPIYYKGGFNQYPDCKDYLLPLFEKYEIDFSFVGHVHGYERGFRNNINYVLTGGGGGTGPVKDDGYIDPGYPQTEYSFREIYNFCKVEVDGDEATLSSYDIFGKKIDDTKVIATSVKNEKEEKISFSNKLFNAYPNPFNPTTEIKYSITNTSRVELKVYNVLGQEVVLLVNKYQNKGEFNVTFNADTLPSGTYYVQLKIVEVATGKSVSYSNKLLLLK